MLDLAINNKHQLSWFLSGIGANIYKVEINTLADFLSFMNSGRVLQLGGPPLIKSFTKFHFVHYDEGVNFPSIGHNVCGDFTRLGLLSESIDLVVSPHLHEIDADFATISAEVYRVLKYDGYFIVYGFNPMSLWGLQSLLGLGKVVPWCNKFYNSSTMVRTVTEQEFAYIGCESYYSGIYSNSKLLYDRLKLTNKFDKLRFGAIYMLVFQKRSATITLNTEQNKYFRQISLHVS